MSKKTSAELSAGKKPLAEQPFHKNHSLESKLSLGNKPDSKAYTTQRFPDHDKSQTEKGRH